MAVQIQVRRDTAANWTSANPTLAQGEIGLETDTGKLKIGTGVTAWNSISYFVGNIAGTTLDAIGDVTITSVQNGDFLRYNGSASAWINDPVNLSTDTVGDYVQSIIAGTGVTLSNNSGEGATPTVAIGQDVATSASVQFAKVTAPVTGNLTGNADTATSLQTARTISLGGDLSGSASFNGTSDITISASVVNSGISIDEISDVVITNPLEFQTLEYNGTEWVNANAPSSVYVRNAEATTITTGTAVYLFGATGDHATVKRADNTTDTTSSKTVGIVASNILASENGVVVSQGYVDGIDLSVGYTSGDVLWLGKNGQFTKTKPTAPDHLVFIGVVVRATNNGIIYVSVQNGYELDELHNVKINGVTDGQFLRYNSASVLWVNDTINLGTDTAGDYVQNLTAGTGVTLSNNSGEGAAPTVAIGQDVATSASVTFAKVETTGDVVIGGDLTVNGTTTTLNTNNLAIEDNIVVLNSNVTGTPSVSAGIEVERGDLSNVLVRWNETADKWDLTNDGTVYGNIVTTADSGTVTSAMIANETIVNGDISTTAEITDTKLATISTAGKVSNSATTATNNNTANAIVSRDASGNFTAGTVSAELSGNSSTATKLFTARTIAGQLFDGTASIAIAPTDLTGVTADASEINILDGATLSTTELNYVDGVTSAIQTQLDLKAPSASPEFTGVPTAPTAAPLTNSNQVATTAYTDAAITALIGSASAALDTLGELANAINDDADFGQSVATSLSFKAPLADPTFTGSPSSTTPPVDDNSTRIATTAYVIGQGYAKSASPTFTGVVSGISKSMVGLGNVDNTSDANKPVSTAAQAALDLKANLASPTLTGTPAAPTAPVNTNTTQIATTAFAQTAANNAEANAIGAANALTYALADLTDGVTASGAEVNILDGATLTTTELNYVDGVTSSIQTQLDSKAPLSSPALTGTPTAPTALTADNSTRIATTAYADVSASIAANSAIQYLNNIGDVVISSVSAGQYIKWDGTQWVNTGIVVGDITSLTSSVAELNLLDGVTATTAEINILDGVTSTASELNVLDGITASTAELNLLDGVTATTSELNILDGVLASASEINILDGATLTTTELNYVDGVTSAIQTQIDTKAPTANPTFTGSVTLPSDPSLALQAATKQYVDNVAAGITFDAAVQVSTTTPLPDVTYSNGSSGVGATLTKSSNGAIGSIDGYAVGLGERILVKDQASALQNGIYEVTTLGSASVAFVLTRPTDSDTNTEIKYGKFVFVQNGDSNGGFGFINTSPTNPIAIGTDSITYTTFNAAQTTIAGAGLTKTGNTVDVVTANSGRIVVNADNIDLASGVVTAGTYRSVTVDTYGRVTAGTAPTTVSGYGITDALTTSAELNDLADVSTAGATNGQFLQYASGTDSWAPATIPSVSVLDDVGDVVITSASPNQVLQWNGTNWVNATINGGATISTSAPSSPQSGQFWFDSDTGSTYVYYDSFWIEVGASGVTISTSSTAPASPVTGQVWFNTTTSVSYVYYNSAWVEIGINTVLNTIDAKGDLLVGTADNTISKLPAGSNNSVLVADSAQATGLKWASAQVVTADVETAMFMGAF